MSFGNAYKRYLSGQIMIFFNIKTFQNDFFMKEIENKVYQLDLSHDLNEIKQIVEDINHILHTYIDHLIQLNIVSKYKGEQYKNIYPIFEPFYVFYEQKEQQSFTDVFNRIFSEGN